MPSIVIVGAGGHAKVAWDAAVEAGFHVHGFLDDDPGRHGTLHCGRPILGSISLAADMRVIGVEGVLVAVGDNLRRRQLLERAVEAGLRPVTVVHPCAWLHPSVKVGEGTLVLAGAVVNIDSRLGANCILNTSCSVDHDCVIGDGVHLAPGVHLGGQVEVGDGAFVGIGAVIMPGIHVGSRAVVGAGAVVNRPVAADSVVIGVPARPMEKSAVDNPA